MFYDETRDLYDCLTGINGMQSYRKNALATTQICTLIFGGAGGCGGGGFNQCN